MGAPDTRNLPTNAEIDQALRLFRELFQKGEHDAVLRGLREQALAAMELLETFNPYLTGSVLSGSAGRHSDINLLLYADSPKDVELFLINRRMPYRVGERRLSNGDGTMTCLPSGLFLNPYPISRKKHNAGQYTPTSPTLTCRNQTGYATGFPLQRQMVMKPFMPL